MYQQTQQVVDLIIYSVQFKKKIKTKLKCCFHKNKDCSIDIDTVIYLKIYVYRPLKCNNI